MNHTTFNDPIKGIRTDHFGSELSDALSSVLAHGAVTSPLIEWEHSNGQDSTYSESQLASPIAVAGALAGEVLPFFLISYVLAAVCDDPKHLPFQDFRLSVRTSPPFRSESKIDLRLWVHCTRIGLSILSVFCGDRKNVVGLHHFDFASRSLAFEFSVGGKLNRANDPNAGDSVLIPFCLCILDCGSPNNFLASVAPKAEARSVEWVQARTHHVLLDRDHPANCKKVGRGAEITVDEDELKRMAHHRRAHTRVLRSKVFKHKQGRTIRVKAAWVGPDEWEQFGSIYRMVRPGVPAAITI